MGTHVVAARPFSCLYLRCLAEAIAFPHSVNLGFCDFHPPHIFWLYLLVRVFQKTARLKRAKNQAGHLVSPPPSPVRLRNTPPPPPPPRPCQPPPPPGPCVLLAPNPCSYAPSSLATIARGLPLWAFFACFARAQDMPRCTGKQC